MFVTKLSSLLSLIQNTIMDIMCVMQGLVSGKLKVEIEDNEVAVAALERVNIETLLMDTTK